MLTSLATRGKFDAFGPIPDRVNVENDNDIIFYIMDDRDITTEHLRWTLYKRSSSSDRYTEVVTRHRKDGEIKINLNQYGLQYQDNQYLLKVYLEKNGFLVGETSFWYYYLKHTRIPKVVPYHADSTYLQYTGGGGIGVAPMYIERPLPSITITNFKDDEENLCNINIYVNKIIDLNL